ncbi:hypothetical protein [Pseudooceanicola atlanticus]|uniref:hypothetical protein n=1 Tax=Pseudooceanicola atlanticus TaxID=1461694 RepID=UPI0006939ED3|nr:hypothetical protein [Pseudooceanicola atlanticus]
MTSQKFDHLLEIDRPLATLASHAERYSFIYRETELNLRSKLPIRLKRDKLSALELPEGVSEDWSMDSMADRIGDGRQFRLLKVLDNFNRKGSGIQIDFSLLAESGVRALNHIIGRRAKDGAAQLLLGRLQRQIYGMGRAQG